MDGGHSLAVVLLELAHLLWERPSDRQREREGERERERGGGGGGGGDNGYFWHSGFWLINKRKESRVKCAGFRTQKYYTYRVRLDLV